ncbi:MAG: hypothetical protein L0177_16865 [Chloroflexi bacterium]|nr:hypothetical protein [Chloroflexota bacterium]
MSEYQYYEFQAVDRPLTKQEMSEARALSTRASIMPTSSVNEYHWGDFKGDPASAVALDCHTLHHEAIQCYGVSRA